MIAVATPARLAFLGVLRGAIAGLESYYAGQPGAPDAKEVYAWGLAVYEAATNVVRHGYAGGGDAMITLSIVPDAGCVTFALTDGGAPNTAWPYTPPVAIEPGDGGHGLLIIHRVMDEVSYGQDADGHNVMTMVARFPKVPSTPVA